MNPWFNVLVDGIYSLEIRTVILLLLPPSVEQRAGYEVLVEFVEGHNSTSLRLHNTPEL